MHVDWFFLIASSDWIVSLHVWVSFGKKFMHTVIHNYFTQLLDATLCRNPHTLKLIIGGFLLTISVPSFKFND